MTPTTLRKVLLVRASSYTGGTWVTLVAGSHDDVIYVGNPKKFEEDLTESGRGVCRVHGKECPYWGAALDTTANSKERLVSAFVGPTSTQRRASQPNK